MLFNFVCSVVVVMMCSLFSLLCAFLNFAKLAYMNETLMLFCFFVTPLAPVWFMFGDYNTVLANNLNGLNVSKGVVQNKKWARQRALVRVGYECYCVCVFFSRPLMQLTVGLSNVIDTRPMGSIPRIPTLPASKILIAAVFHPFRTAPPLPSPVLASLPLHNHIVDDSRPCIYILRIFFCFYSSL